MERYRPQEIEEKWRKTWEREKLYRTAKDPKKKYYCLDMFPYPSGDGLHVGHWRGYVLSDMWARYQKMRGYDVLHPIGFDAFGLPAENAAIQRKSHPKKFTQEAIGRIRGQLKEIGTLYDWEREIITSDPAYYKWTQWLFLMLYKQGLAYRKKALVNWCPSDQTVLANEQVVDGKCERCDTAVEKQEREQWFFKITKYAQELLNDLEKLEWPERVKTLQRNWIGRSEGALLSFAIADTKEKIEVFTTRPDTLFGCTYLVLAPEHPLLEKITLAANKPSVAAYRKTASALSELERVAEKREKTGVNLGAFALHPVTKEKLPIFVADYVVMGYGTGAIMAVPAHDLRDFEFAKKYNLPIKLIIDPVVMIFHSGTDNHATLSGKEKEPFYQGEKCYPHHGRIINSPLFEGYDSLANKHEIISIIEDKKIGERKIIYRLRDWLISRQRYWGAPIPIVYCQKCGIQPVAEKDLPVILPHDADFKPTGESPLARHATFTKTTCPNCNGTARRETDTMDTFVDSSWYFLRYTDPYNTTEAFSQEELKKWLPVDMYVGGIEHAILHLLYARFITKALADAKLVGFREPFTRLFNIGIVYLHGAKMSKSKGNVVNPDELVAHFGADTLRGYELFLGPADKDVEWNPRAITGIYRFLERIWEISGNVGDHTDSPARTKKLIFEVTREIEGLRPNTALARLMSISHDYAHNTPNKAEFALYVQLLAPFFPHLAEELWHALGKSDSIFNSRWPEGEEHLDGQLTIVVQVNGKLRATVALPRDITRKALEERTRAGIERHIQGKSVKKVIVVDGRLVNFVVQ